ncbi:MAG: thioredoxin family protein [Acidobacteria bacterium]|nr:thioredoxin family protein [Acidobacteriota bacterium]
MSLKRQVEVFSAGCPACEKAVEAIKRIACSSCEVHVLDMHDQAVASKAASYGINRVPSIVVEGKLADCCHAGRIDEGVLRQLGVGTPLQP